MAAPIRFEGRWIDPEQMDLWQCIDQVALDAMRARVEPDDEDTTDEHEQI